MPHRTYCVSIGLLLFLLFFFTQAANAIPPLVSFQGEGQRQRG